MNNICIGDILLNHLPLMAPYYVQYCAGQSAAVVKVNIKFGSDQILFQSMEPKQHLSLAQYLTMPLQRSMKYPFLIEQLYSWTPASHPDRDNCAQAFHEAKSFCKQIDDHLESHQWAPFEQLAWIQTHLLITDHQHLIDFNSETQFLGPRVLMHSGFLLVKETNQILAIFLFNDIMIVAVPKRSSLHEHLSYNNNNTNQHPRYLSPIDIEMVQHSASPPSSSFFGCTKALSLNFVCLFRKPFLLDEVIITDRSNTRFSFDLHLDMNKLKLQASTEQQYQMWMKKIDFAKRQFSSLQRKQSHSNLMMLPTIKPIAILLLTSIEAVQLYTRNCRFFLFV